MSQNAIWETTHEWVDDSIEKMMRFSWDIDNSLSKSMPNNNRRRNAQFDGYRSAFQQQPVREEYSWTDEERALRMRERRLQEKRKTSLCNQYKQSGFCDYGTECRFAHGVHELRMMPEPRNYKTKLCRNYERDQHCSYGDRCQFIHRKRI